MKNKKLYCMGFPPILLGLSELISVVTVIILLISLIVISVKLLRKRTIGPAPIIINLPFIVFTVIFVLISFIFHMDYRAEQLYLIAYVAAFLQLMLLAF